MFDGRFVDNNITYRAYRFPWNGTPATPPAVATTRQGPKMTVYASWNGATNVVAWRVLGGSNAGALRPVATADKSGFETAITTRARGYVAVQALGTKSRPLGSRSAVVQVPPPPPPRKPKPKPHPPAAKPPAKPPAKKIARSPR